MRVCVFVCVCVCKRGRACVRVCVYVFARARTHACLYIIGNSVLTATSEAKIRLRAGSTEYEGRLEVFRNGVWGTVCRERSSSYIDHAINAHVACRELFGTG